MSDVEFLPAPPTAPGPPALDGPPPTIETPGELPSDRPRSRRGLGLRSLTARLIVGVVSLVLLVVVLIGGGTWYALRYFLAERLDQQLQSTAGGNVYRLFTGTMTNGFPVPAPQGVWAVAIAPGDKPLYPHNQAIRSMRLTTSERNMLAARKSQDPISVTTTDGQRLRVSVRSIGVSPANDNDPADAIQVPAVIGLSTDEEESTLDRLVNLELVIGASAVVLALLTTSLGVRFSLRRLRQVTTTANEVAAELSPTGTGLERRVDVPDDGSEVGQLAESMNTLLSAVETQFAARLESEARLRQFLADASHELRTPLTSIRGYAELARMQKAAGADAEDNLSRIESEGTRMSRLVEDLLTLARSDQPADAEPKRELVDAAELVDEAVSGTRAAFAGRDIRAEASGELHLIGDHDQLLRAIRNLVANSASHTDPERPIVVRGLLDGNDVVVQVIDGGPGLPPEEAAHVFERFWRADKARSRARGGSGLGLSIVASIVAAHGGTVRFDSSVEYGSTVTVRLPAVTS